MLVTLAVCGLVMALVLLSDPRVMAQIETAAGLVKSRTVSSPEVPWSEALPTQIAPALAAPLQISPVQAAPAQLTRANRVRVRRAGILSDD